MQIKLRQLLLFVVGEYVERINQVTAEQIRDVARRYLTDDNLTIAYLDPQPITENPKPARVLGGHHAF